MAFRCRAGDDPTLYAGWVALCIPIETYSFVIFRGWGPSFMSPTPRWIRA